jgi:formate dehydrogenase major subunit
MNDRDDGTLRATGRPDALMGLLELLKTHVGLVPNPISAATRATTARIHGASAHVSVCPYCAVGCSQLVYTRDGQIIDIEGNDASPINGGTLCPKGSATFGLINMPARVTTVKYRAPYADHWEDRPLDWAMERIAQLVKRTRDAAFEATDAEGTPVNRTLAIASLGGATLDNEENYLIKKLFTAGLGIVAVENQARI